MKRFALLAVIIALSSSLAFADVKDFSGFSIDVPEGWTAVNDGSKVVITNDPTGASLTFTVIPENDESLDGIFETLAGDDVMEAGEGRSLTVKNADKTYSVKYLNEKNGRYTYASADNIKGVDPLSDILVMLDTVRNK